MTSTATTPTGHPIARFVEGAHQALDELAATAALSMSPEEQRSTLVGLHRLGARFEELRLRVLAAGDRADFAADSAATSTGAWLANATTHPRGKAHADVNLALALDETYAATRAALAAGLVDADQARVIVHAVHRVHEEAAEAVAADPSIPERAEKHLITLAGQYDTKALKAQERTTPLPLPPPQSPLHQLRHPPPPQRQSPVPQKNVTDRPYVASLPAPAGSPSVVPRTERRCR